MAPKVKQQPWAATKALARARALAPHDAKWADEIEAKVLASCHSYQRDFVMDPGRRVSAVIGRGGGKTTGAKARAVIKMARIPRAKLVFIATCGEHARDLMWEPLKDITERLGIETVMNEERMTCRFKRNGSTIRLFGADDRKQIDKLRGQSFHEVQIDEAASYENRLLSNLIERIIGPRLGDYEGCIAMFGTPGHMLSGIFYDATSSGNAQNRPYRDRANVEYGEGQWKKWSSHFWTLPMAAKEVPAIARLWSEAQEEKAAKGWGDDHPVWRREYLGIWAADDTETIYKYRPRLPDGTAWNEWDPELVGPMRMAKLPGNHTDWVYAYGMDMGHSDSFALTVLAASPSDPTRTIYHVLSYGRTKMYARTIAQLLLGTDDTRESGCRPHERAEGVIGATGWPAGIVADLAGMGGAVIEELGNVYGVPVKASEKAGKFGAVELLNGDLVEGRLKILKGSTLATQLAELQWVANEFGQLKENRAQANDHADSLLYSRRLLANIFESDLSLARPTPDRSEPRPRADAVTDDGMADLDESPATEVDDFGSLLGNDGYGDWE